MNKLDVSAVVHKIITIYGVISLVHNLVSDTIIGRYRSQDGKSYHNTADLVKNFEIQTDEIRELLYYATGEYDDNDVQAIKDIIQSILGATGIQLTFMGVKYEAIRGHVFKNNEYKGSLRAYLNGDNELGIKAEIVSKSRQPICHFTPMQFVWADSGCEQVAFWECKHCGHTKEISRNLAG